MLLDFLGGHDFVRHLSPSGRWSVLFRLAALSTFWSKKTLDIPFLVWYKGGMTQTNATAKAIFQKLHPPAPRVARGHKVVLGLRLHSKGDPSGTLERPEALVVVMMAGVRGTTSIQVGFA